MELGHRASVPAPGSLVSENSDALDLEVARVAGHDDGIVAWLNGSFLANRNASAAPSWNSSALAARPNALAAQFEEIALTSQLGQLQ